MHKLETIQCLGKQPYNETLLVCILQCPQHLLNLFVPIGLADCFGQNVASIFLVCGIFGSLLNLAISIGLFLTEDH